MLIKEGMIGGMKASNSDATFIGRSCFADFKLHKTLWHKIKANKLLYHI